jgi:hypothetical protein
MELMENTGFKRHKIHAAIQKKMVLKYRICPDKTEMGSMMFYRDQESF